VSISILEGTPSGLLLLTVFLSVFVFNKNLRTRNGGTELFKSFELYREGSLSGWRNACYYQMHSPEVDPSRENSPLVIQFAKPIQCAQLLDSEECALEDTIEGEDF